MKITQDVRDYAEAHGVGIQPAVQLGMREKAAEFRATGVRLYL